MYSLVRLMKVTLLGSAIFFLYHSPVYPIAYTVCLEAHSNSDEDDEGCEKRCHHHRSYEEEVENDPSYQLEDDTAWPAQREDFSDQLMR